jgi:biopolymer transport protein TolQ
MENAAPNALSLAYGTGPVVKGVLILLIALSVLSWSVIIGKWMTYKKVQRASVNFLNIFWNSKSLDNIFSDSKLYSESPISNVFRAGFLEYQKVTAKGLEKKATSETIGTKGMENVERALKRASVSEAIRMETALPWLATIASVAPFIGLFGTVWGIMNAFQGIGSGGPATLQNVAPGIAEALIATAISLATAIPAVVAYNLYVNRLRGFRADMENFAIDFSNILRRSYLE